MKNPFKKNDRVKDEDGEPKTVGGFSPTTVAEEEADPDAKSVYDNVVGPLDPEAVLEEKAAGRAGRVNEVIKVAESKKTITIPASEKLVSTPAIEKRVSEEDPLAIIADKATHAVVETEDGATLDAKPINHLK